MISTSLALDWSQRYIFRNIFTVLARALKPPPSLPGQTIPNLYLRLPCLDFSFFSAFKCQLHWRLFKYALPGYILTLPLAFEYGIRGRKSRQPQPQLQPQHVRATDRCLVYVLALPPPLLSLTVLHRCVWRTPQVVILCGFIGFYCAYPKDLGISNTDMLIYM